MSDFVRDLETELLAAARRRTARARRWRVRRPPALLAAVVVAAALIAVALLPRAQDSSVAVAPAAGAVLHRLPRRQPAAARRALYLQPVWTMMIRAALTLLAVAGAGATFAACGGVPGNAVATVDGEAIDEDSAIDGDGDGARTRRAEIDTDGGGGEAQARRLRRGPAEVRRAAQDAVQASTSSCATRCCSS